LLQEFLTNTDRILTRELLLRRVWGVAGQLETRTVDNFIMRLRRLIEPNPTQPVFLESVRGRGYRFNPNAKG
jgi:two-component system OmpR family response regulator